MSVCPVTYPQLVGEGYTYYSWVAPAIEDQMGHFTYFDEKMHLLATKSIVPVEVEGFDHSFLSLEDKDVVSSLGFTNITLPVATGTLFGWCHSLNGWVYFPKTGPPKNCFFLYISLKPHPVPVVRPRGGTALNVDRCRKLKKPEL